MARVENGGRRGGFVASKDKILYQQDLPPVEGVNYGIIVALVSYDGYAPKIALYGKGQPDAFGGVKTWAINRIPPAVLETLIAFWPKFKRAATKHLE